MDESDKKKIVGFLVSQAQLCHTRSQTECDGGFAVGFRNQVVHALESEKDVIELLRSFLDESEGLAVEGNNKGFTFTAKYKCTYLYISIYRIQPLNISTCASSIFNRTPITVPQYGACEAICSV